MGRDFREKGVNMTEKKWKETIRSNCIEVGTYKPAFNTVIDSLAAVLAQRDKTWKEFKKSGGKSVVEHTNKYGAVNLIKNPRLVMWDHLNQSALAYCRDLGLSPAGLKKLHEKALQQPKKNPLAEALKGLG